jgi:hypothetical protein
VTIINICSRKKKILSPGKFPLYPYTNLTALFSVIPEVHGGLCPQDAGCPKISLKDKTVAQELRPRMVVAEGRELYWKNPFVHFTRSGIYREIGDGEEFAI